MRLLVFFFSRYYGLRNFQKCVTHYDTFTVSPCKDVSRLCNGFSFIIAFFTIVCYNDLTTQNLIFTVYKQESYFFTLVKMQTSISTYFYRQLIVLCGSKLKSHFSVCVTSVAHTFLL